MERFGQCDLCKYLHECADEGRVLNVSKEHHDYSHYIRNLGSRCRIEDEYMENLLSRCPDLKEELENPTGNFPVAKEMQLAYEFWKELK